MISKRRYRRVVRAKELTALRNRGLTYAEMSEDTGISSARCRQICDWYQRLASLDGAIGSYIVGTANYRGESK